MSATQPQKKQNQRRIFFALWPEQEVRNTLQNNIKTDVTHFIKSNQVRQVPIHNWHLTLAFVGNVSEEIFACCLDQGSCVTAKAFSVTLNTFDYFARPQIVWLGCDQVDNAWYELVNKLNEVLTVCGYKPDRKHPVPHMSVMRKAKRPMTVTRFKPVTWNVNEFALIESRTTDKGAMYSVVKQWSLG